MVVGHDAPDEVGVGRVQSRQELVKLGPECGRHGLEDLGSGVLTLLLLLDNLEMGCGRMCKISFIMHNILYTICNTIEQASLFLRLMVRILTM